MNGWHEYMHVIIWMINNGMIHASYMIRRIYAKKRPNLEEHINKLIFGKDALYGILSHQKKVPDQKPWRKFLPAVLKFDVFQAEIGGI